MSTLFLPGAALLAGELRRAGLTVHTGPFTELGVYSVDTEDPRLDDVLQRWRAAQGPRTVLLAAPRSFCAGVERAIDIVEAALTRFPHPIYVRKQIVHNVHVVRDLSARGAVFVDELDEVPDGAVVIFSAHGVAPSVRTDATARELHVIDATCPLVTKVHSEVRRFSHRDRQIYLIGHAGHEESVGTLGEAPEDTVLVETVEDVARLPETDRPQSYVMQTTLAIDEAAEVVDALRARFPTIEGPGTDDICYATTNRQNAVRAIAADADVIFVVGSANSSNSVRLAELGIREGTPTRLVEDVGDIPLADLATARTVGLTAGASAAPALVEEIVRELRALGPLDVVERRTTEETVTFNLPRELEGTGR